MTNEDVQVHRRALSELYPGACLITIDQFAAAIGVSLTSARRLVYEGKVKARRLGRNGRVKVSIDDAAQYVARMADHSLPASA